LGVFRIGFALVGLVFCWRLFGIRTFRFDGSWVDSPWLELFHVAWLVVLVMLLLGIGGVLRDIAHFLLCLLLLDAKTIGASVQESLFLLLTFHLLFIRTDGGLNVRSLRAWIGARRADDTAREQPVGSSGGASSSQSNTWTGAAVWWFGVNFGFILVSAGLFKALCPLWQAGIGFRMTFGLPWIRAPFIPDFATDSLLPVLLNHMSIALEVGFLFCFLIARLRLLSLFMLCMFFGGLILPMRLDMIGWIGLLYPLLLLSVTPLKPWRRLEQVKTSGRTLRVALGAMLFSGMMCAMTAFKRWDFTENDYAKTSPVFVGTTADEDAYRDRAVYKLAVGVHRPLDWLFDVIGVRSLNKRTTRQKGWTLFTKRHTVGIYGYRVLVTLQDGTQTEPIRVFEEDLSAGPDSNGFLTVRNFQGGMYALSDLAHRSSFASPEELAEASFLRRHERAFAPYLHYALRDTGENAAKVEILVRPIGVDLTELGFGKTVDHGWQPLVRYDVATDKTEILRVGAFNIQARVPYLENYWVTQHPWTN